MQKIEAAPIDADPAELDQAAEDALAAVRRYPWPRRIKAILERLKRGAR